MKKLVFLAALATIGFATPALAGNYCDTQGGCTGPSGNDWNRWQQRNDPAYGGRRYYGGSNYGGYYGNPTLGDAVVCLLFCKRANPVKDNTAKVNGRVYKNCGYDPAVQIDTPCARETPSYAQPVSSPQVPEGTVIETYIADNGDCVTIKMVNGRRKVFVERR